MSQILILTRFDINNDPRPFRLMSCLADIHDVTVFSSGIYSGAGITSFKLGRREQQGYLAKLQKLVGLFAGKFENIYISSEYRPLTDHLADKRYDLIFCHDPEFLPHVLNQHTTGSRVIFDAREYYPLQFEDNLIWKITWGKYYRYLCKQYMPIVSMNMTVSQGIAERYRKEFGVSVELLQSWPEYQELQPRVIESDHVRIIHHGAANPNRRIELMIKTMDHVDSRFSLDLMLVPTNARYFDFLKKLAEIRPNVRIINPVPLTDIVDVVNRYDIGLFMVPPTTFNLRYSLPNKLFEFIQARVAVAVGPSPEMQKIVSKNDIGIVSGDFKPESMAKLLNELTNEDIVRYKNNCDELSRRCNAASNCEKYKKLVSGKKMLNDGSAN